MKKITVNENGDKCITLNDLADILGDIFDHINDEDFSGLGVDAYMEFLDKRLKKYGIIDKETTTEDGCLFF